MNSVDSLINQALAAGTFSGAAVLFAQDEQVLHQGYYGQTSLTEGKPIDEHTLFDIASLTKVFATTAIAMRLYERDELVLTTKLSEVLPVFSGSPYKEVTLEHLLSHTSGLPDYQPYFNKKSPEQWAALGPDQALETYLTWIAAETAAELGEKRIYSDLGFICLGAVLAKLTGKSLSELFEAEVRAPLGLDETLYKSPGGTLNVAATEQDLWRDKLIQGEVHDENAYALGGSAAHAGIFSTLQGCYRFAHETVRAAQGESEWLTQETIAQFVDKSREYILGWDRPTPPNSQAGKYFPETAIGHLGFTGCSLWIDLEAEVIALLLTNRVHPTRDNEQIKKFRPKLHEALFEAYL